MGEGKVGRKREWETGGAGVGGGRRLCVCGSWERGNGKEMEWDKRYPSGKFKIGLRG